MKKKINLSRKPTQIKKIEDIIGIENQELVAEKTQELQDKIEILKNEGNFLELQKDFEESLESENISQADKLIDKAIEFQIKNNFQLAYFLTRIRNTEKYKILINPQTGNLFQTFEEYFEAKKLKKQTIYRQINAVQTALIISKNNSEKAEKNFEEIGSTKLALVGNFIFSKKTQFREDHNAIKKQFLQPTYLKDKTIEQIKKDIAEFEPQKQELSIAEKMDKYIHAYWINKNSEYFETKNFIVLTKEKFNQIIENQK